MAVIILTAAKPINLETDINVASVLNFVAVKIVSVAL